MRGKSQTRSASEEIAMSSLTSHCCVNYSAAHRHATLSSRGSNTSKAHGARLESRNTPNLTSCVVTALLAINDANIHPNPRNGKTVDRSSSIRLPINSHTLQNTFEQDGLVMTIEPVCSNMKQRSEQLSWKRRQRKSSSTASSALLHLVVSAKVFNG